MLEVHLLAQALRSERVDIESYYRLLSETLGQALPPGMVEVQRRGGLLRRHRNPVALRVHTPGRQLELRAGRHGLEAEIHWVVRGVVISRQPVSVGEWLDVLAEELAKLAAWNTVAREALGRLLGH
ncbi:hypothetical protein [Amycolatopsis taiwanensis]|uniref:Uncharacterized protein n=1 Tax=Amycolatopsis taiwanensis TaxID=342230 RepID=A0A9W6VCJ9_9PSEU|nr:hypothetical protein [Amycolatopsis taiwanensis]GLY63830.1 hypothetical protein Atai01_04490 [Amycolatopsis taiwanensis]